MAVPIVRESPIPLTSKAASLSLASLSLCLASFLRGGGGGGGGV